MRSYRNNQDNSDKSKNIPGEISSDHLTEAYFKKIISEEMKKPSKHQDHNLIDECIKNIAEIKGIKKEFSSEELKEKAQNHIKQSQTGKVASSNLNIPGSSTYVPVPRPMRRKKILLSAVAILICTCLCGVTALAISSDLREWFLAVLNMPVNSKIEDEENNFTYWHNEIEATYHSLDEFIFQVNLDIIYPTVFPEGIALESIERVSYSGSETLMFVFDTIEFNYSIDLNSTDLSIPSSYTEKYQIDNLEIFYWYDEYINSHCAVFIHNNYYYSMNAADFDSLMLVLNNLKGN